MLMLATKLECMGIQYKTGIQPTMARLYEASNLLHPEFNYKADLARLLNTSEQVLTNWESRGVSDKGIVDACERMPGLNALWLKTGKGPTVKGKHLQSVVDETDDDDDYIGIKRVDLKISAGISGYGVEYMNGEKSPIFFRRDWLAKKGYNPEKLYAIPVTGESMETSLYKDDLVVINADDTRQIDGEVFAMNYEGELVIKRLHREAGQWYLSSDNPDKRRFPNKLCQDNCFIIGRIIYKQSERI
jgi:phage repressor protein C with HTH and peptisase S24 domain